MLFASPDRWLWLLIALPIIAFYILRTRLRRRPVATLLFWDQVFEEKRQRKLWQNLRHWLSLLLQLLFVGLLTFALVDPLWRSESDQAQNIVLIVDNSASMQAIDAKTGQSRFALAINEARDVIRSIRPGDTVALMSAGNLPVVVAGMTDFGPAVEEALQSIQPTDGPTRISEAIEAARKLVADPSKRSIYVLSDGSVPAEDELPSVDEVQWVQVGSSRDNAAITTFQVRRSTIDPIGYSLLIEVSNFSDEPLMTRVQVKLDEALVDVIPLDIEPNESWRQTIESTSRLGGVLTATIDGDDGLAVDNQAWAVIPSRPLIPVELIAPDPDDAFYLRTVLESIPLLQFGESADLPAESSIATLKVFSGTVPEELPDGPLLIVNPPTAGPPLENGQPAWTLAEPSLSPIVAKEKKDSPLMQYVSLQNVLLDGARDVQVNPDLGEATSLLETADGASVLLAVDRPQGRMLLLTADLSVADLPLRIAFPVLMTNSIHWFYRQSGDINPALSTGQLAKVPWDVAQKYSEKSAQKTAEATLIDPAGEQRLITVSNDRANVGPLASVGLAALLSDKVDRQTGDTDKPPPTPRQLLQRPDVSGMLLAVNLTDAAESDLRMAVRDEPALAARPRGGAPLWFYLVMVAFGLILSEWWMFNRRVVA